MAKKKWTKKAKLKELEYIYDRLNITYDESLTSSWMMCLLDIITEMKHKK